MKKFKKIAVLLVALIVAMSVLLVMASCGGDETDNSSQGGQSSSTDSSSGTENSSANNSDTNNTTDDNNGGDDNSGNDDGNNGGNTGNDGNNDGGNTGNGGNNDGGNTGNGGNNDGGNTENPNLVKVTVLNQLGNPVKNAEIQICQGETCFNKPIITGNDGVGTREFTLGTGVLKAKINSIDGMIDFIASSEYVYFEENSRELTITVQKVVVNVYDDKESAIEGAVVQLYQGENAFDGTIITDANGEAFAFVALNGNAISAKVTEIMSGSGYVISNDTIEIEADDYNGTIIVKKNASYSVRVSNMFGEAIVGAKVKLYSGKIFEDVANTDENGMVTFENLGEGQYSVEIIITSPAYKVLGASEDGRHYFAAGSTVLEVSVVDVPEITYTVSVNGSDGGDIIDVLNIDNEIIATITTDETGVATFVAENGYYTAVLRTEGKYAAPAFFVKDDSATGKITVSNKTAGSSKDAPIILVGELNLSIEAGQTLWFAIPNANKKTVTVVSEKGVGIKLGELLDFVNDETVEFVTDMFIAGKGEMVVIGIKSNEAQMLTLEPNAPGTINEPIDLSGCLSDTANMEKVLIDSDTSVYYTYTADKDGVICVEVNGVTVMFNGNDTGLDLGDGKWAYPVMAGETVLVSFTHYETVDANVAFTYGDLKVDYTVYVSVDGVSPEGIVVILYANVDGTLTEIARKTVDGEGICVFENISYASNYVVKVENCPNGYESVYETVEALTSNFVSYMLTTIKTGAPDAPFEFDTVNELKETVTVPEDGTVWYTVYVRPSMENKFYIVAKSGNAIIKVYGEDTNNDGIINGDDTPIGVSVVFDGMSTYMFETNNKIYTIAVSTIDGSAEEIEVEYASQALSAGSTEENAIEITDAGTYTATVNGMVYYVFANNDSCKLTITVTGDATLKVIHRSLEGSTLEDAENNTYTVDTEGTWIYFAISAENAGEYEFTVTVE